MLTVLFFIGACVEEESNNNDSNNEANNTDGNNEVNNSNNGDNNTENPVCDGKQDNPNCPVNQECTDTEFWHQRQGMCVEKCDHANCYFEDGEECDALTGNCFLPEIDPIENPCAEWAWMRPNERAWQCTPRPNENLGLSLEERPDGCFMKGQILFVQGFYLPHDRIEFYEETDMFLVHGTGGDFECFAMGQ